MTDAEDPIISVEYVLTGNIATADVFRRAQPVTPPAPLKAWDVAKLVIDHGCYILTHVNEVRAGSVKDLVTAGLLRRALATSESIRLLLFRGLEEPSQALLRTLIDIDLALHLIVNDTTDETAKKLAGYNYLTGRRQTKKILNNETTRGVLKRGTGHFEATIDATKRLQGYFDSPTFDSVRDELALQQHWHGFNSVEDAFESVGRVDDYLQQYSPFSPYVHASNVEHDFRDIDAAGRFQLRAIAQDSERGVMTTLGAMLLWMTQILERFLESKPPSGAYPKNIRAFDPVSGNEEFVTQLHMVRAKVFDILKAVGIE